jgi:Domain of unknown function (DUF5060)/Protein of unknown function (DUF4038)
MSGRLALLAALMVAGVRAQEPSACNNTPAYSSCEIVFELSDAAAAKYPEPYKSVEMRVEFRSPRHRTLAVPAFWDGGRRMVVRFAPTEGGAWDYRISSNVSELDGKTGGFTAAASASPGFIHAENVHHWAYAEKDARGLYQAHLWMGATEMGFAFEDEAGFRAMADARAAQKFNHVRGTIWGTGGEAIYRGPDAPVLEQFKKLDARILYLNQKGIAADLILGPDTAALVKAFPAWEQRRRFIRYLAGRYAAMNVTWQMVEHFEDAVDGRPLLKEMGTVMKELDPYQHPRTSGARITSGPLLDDGWMNFAAYGTSDDNVGAIEHQIYGVPFVNLEMGREGAGEMDAAAFRKRLWNTTMNGQAPTYANTSGGAAGANAAGAKQMTVWFDFFSDTRYWELEPYFDVDGGRALALEDTEYVVYMEKAGPLELTVEKHAYEAYWINPADGAATKVKFKGEHFTGAPPNASHDWVLHVVREGRVEGMNKSYKFESRDIVLQEVESNSPKVPFAIEQPVDDLNVRVSPPFATKITKETRATRSMLWLWTGDVSADGQGYRVLATGAKGVMRPLTGIANRYPAVMHVRVYGMNANGKVYALDRAFQLNQ